MISEPPGADELLPRILAAWPKLELRHRRRLLREAEQLAGIAKLMHKSTMPAAVPGEGRWIPASEAAAMLGVAKSTVSFWVKRGKIRPEKAEAIGGMLHIDPDEIKRIQRKRNQQ